MPKQKHTNGSINVSNGLSGGGLKRSQAFTTTVSMAKLKNNVVTCKQTMVHARSNVMKP